MTYGQVIPSAKHQKYRKNLFSLIRVTNHLLYTFIHIETTEF